MDMMYKEVYHDYTYRNLLQRIYSEGEDRGDRTGTGTRSLFGCRMEFDLRYYFPLLTAKELHWPSIAHELLWFITGKTNTKYLTDNGVKIWNEWADERGNLGPVYGAQWRTWGADSGSNGWDYKLGIDQLQGVIDRLQSNPECRRHIVSAWNVGDLDKMALQPCHMMFQFYVSKGKYLDCLMYQRSCDMFLGVPYNIASYSLLIHMVAHLTGLRPGRFIWTGGDCHIYDNHTQQSREYIERNPTPSPELKLINPPERIDGWDINNFELIGYNPLSKIKAPISV
jgi:thymidylate synthase